MKDALSVTVDAPVGSLSVGLFGEDSAEHELETQKAPMTLSIVIS